MEGWGNGVKKLREVGWVGIGGWVGGWVGGGCMMFFVECLLWRVREWVGGGVMVLYFKELGE